MTPSPEQIERWWETLARHGGGGMCPICKVPRCWRFSDAFAALLEYDVEQLDEMMQATRPSDGDDVTTGRTVPA